MKVAQIAKELNIITNEVLGKEIIVQEDLSNIVDLGTEILNMDAVENYTRALVDHIGRMVFVDRIYGSRAPSVQMDAWEYGSILEKIDAEMPEAEENQSWELNEGQQYECHIFYGPKVSAKFFNSKTTFEVRMSFAELQVKSAFSDAGQMTRFFSMIYSKIENSLTVKMDSLTMRVINNFAAEIVADEFPNATSYSGKTSTRAVNLLYEYNQANGTSLTAATAMTDLAFLKFASATIAQYIDDISVMSTLYNAEGAARFTPRDKLKVVFNSRYVRAADVYLQSDTYHNEYTRIPEADIVPFWQGSGKGRSFTDATTINVKTASGNAVNISGVIGIIFDRDALGIANEYRRVTSEYTPSAEFYTNWYKMDVSYFNDTSENGVLFYVA